MFRLMNSQHLSERQVFRGSVQNNSTTAMYYLLVLNISIEILINFYYT